MNPLLVGALIGGGALLLTRGKEEAPRAGGPTVDARPQDREGQATDGAGQNKVPNPGNALPITETPSDPGTVAGKQTPVDPQSVPELELGKNAGTTATPATPTKTECTYNPATRQTTCTQVPVEISVVGARSQDVLKVAESVELKQTGVGAPPIATADQKRLAEQSMATAGVTKAQAARPVYTPGKIAAAATATASVPLSRANYKAACTSCGTSPQTRATANRNLSSTGGLKY